MVEGPKLENAKLVSNDVPALTETTVAQSNFIEQGREEHRKGEPRIEAIQAVDHPRTDSAPVLINSIRFYIDADAKRSVEGQLYDLEETIWKEVLRHQNDITEIVIATSAAEQLLVREEPLHTQVLRAVEASCFNMSSQDEKFFGMKNDFSIIHGHKRDFLPGEIQIDFYTSEALQNEKAYNSIGSRLQRADYQGVLSTNGHYAQVGLSSSGLLGEGTEAQIDFGIAPQRLGVGLKKTLVEKDDMQIKAGGEIGIGGNESSGFGPTLSVQTRDFNLLGQRLGLEVTGVLDFVQGAQVKVGLRIPLHGE